MVKVFLGLSLVAMLATAGLSFGTKSKIGVLSGGLKTAQKDLSEKKSRLAKVEGDLKKTEDDLMSSKAIVEERDKEIAKQKGEVEELAKNVAAAKAEADAKVKAAVEGLTAKLEEAKKNPVAEAPLPVAALEELKAQNEKIKAEFAELQQVNKTMEAQKKDAEEKLLPIQRQLDEYRQGYVRNGLTGKVLAYNPGWNFVVLSIGDRQGLKAASQLIVTRGGQPIAKVKVTTVEPASAIADIIPGSIAKGDFVQPGDVVVYESKR
jgi:hypothetical protein